MPSTKLFHKKLKSLPETHDISLSNYATILEKALIRICTRYYKSSEQGNPGQAVELGGLRKGLLGTSELSLKR